MLIGLTGQAGSGKDEIAKILVRRYGFTRMAMADSLKEIARDHFEWNGQKDERGRRLLQVIGTECGRAYTPDLWVRKLNRKIVQERGSGKVWNVVIPDIRFLNEAAWVATQADGVVIRVVGRGYYDQVSPFWRFIPSGPLALLPDCLVLPFLRRIVAARAHGHQSEQEMRSIRAEWTIDNSGTLERLEERVVEIVEMLKAEGNPL